MIRSVRSSALTALAVLVLLVGAACDGGPEPVAAPSTSPPPSRTPSPSPSATPAPFRLTYAALVAALPTAADLPGFEPGGGCEQPAESCSHVRSGRADGHGAVRGFDGRLRIGLHEMALTSAVAWPTAAIARRWVAGIRSQSEDDYIGVFHHALETQPDGTYRPGEDGIGVLSDAHHGRWHGFFLTARLRYQRVDLTSPPGVHTYTVLSRGRYAVVVQVDRWADQTGTARAGAISRRLVAEVLGRLDASGG